MVARVTIPSSIARALNYNEQKMKEGKAVCLYAHNYLKEAGHLNFYEKLQRFEQLIALNERATTNTLHVSLNFDPSEKIEQEKLTEIARVYMQKIGFGEQPYLVYQHHDAGHPHIHIVSTNIQKEGKRISLHNIGRNQSMKARKEIEIAFGLVRAEQQKQKLKEAIRPLNAQRIVYGKSETKRGITNVLDTVINQYKYTSIPELNAILRLYNMVADRGQEHGIIFKKQGLVYRILDDQGNKTGVPVKASSIYSKPTLALLEKKFIENGISRQEYKKHLKTSIDWIMLQPPKSLEQFKESLQKERISLVIRQNEQGMVYGMTYIDHTTKSVFNGSDIGKAYSAKSILEKCGQSFSLAYENNENRISISHKKTAFRDTPDKYLPVKEMMDKTLDIMISPTEDFSYMPEEIRKRKKKKKNNRF
jgi:hypothetical protein